MMDPRKYSVTRVHLHGQWITQLTYLDYPPRMIATLQEAPLCSAFGLAFELCLGDKICNDDARHIANLLVDRTPKLEVRVHSKSIHVVLGVCYLFMPWPERMGIAITNAEGTWRVSGLESILAYIKVQGIEGHTLVITYEQ